MQFHLALIPLAATTDQAANEIAAPVMLSRNLTGAQLKTFRIRLPTKAPSALPKPIQMKNVVTLIEVLASDVVVAAPVKKSMIDLLNQAPSINPINDSVLTMRPRRQPENNMNAPNPSKIKSK